MSIYREDFVHYRETMRFQSKPWASRQNRETWQVCMKCDRLFNMSTGNKIQSKFLTRHKLRYQLAEVASNFVEVLLLFKKL